MAKYATWDDYVLMYPNGMDESGFEAAALQAEALIDIWTAGRAAQAQDWALQQRKECVCALAEMISHRGGSNGGARLVSVSSDGYSERYSAAGMEDELRAEAMRRLSGTGLVSAL